MLYPLKGIVRKIKRSHSLKAVFTAVVLSASTHVQAAPVAGWLEGVYVDGIKNRIRGKLDTGALTSSIHGTHTRLVEHDGEEYVQFEFLWEKDDKLIGPYTVEAPLVRKVRIKDHEDESRERYVVNMNFALNGECFTAEFSIADRSKFNYPVLLGRRFLAGEVTVDASKTFTDLSEPKGKSACRKVEDHEIEQKVKLDREKQKAELQKLEEAKAEEAEEEKKSSKKSDSKDA